jgi:hypothetical protein
MYDFISSYLKKPLEKNLFYYLNSAWKTFYIQKLK